MEIKMDKNTVYDILKQNRNKHVREYKKQLEGWQKKYEQYTNELNEWSRDPSGIRPPEPPKPIDYEKDYTELMEFVDDSVDYVMLDDYEYDRIIRDNFGWKHTFETNSAIYTANA